MQNDIELSEYDSADYLKSEEDIGRYLYEVSVTECMNVLDGYYTMNKAFKVAERARTRIQGERNG